MNLSPHGIYSGLMDSVEKVPQDLPNINNNYLRPTSDSNNIQLVYKWQNTNIYYFNK